jgi:peroxiredoxin family protein
MEAAIFFTFYGLNIIHKDFDRRLRVSAVANPAMPMPVSMPDIVTALPGMRSMATGMMKSMFRRKGVASIRELLDVARESEVRLIACQMTMDVFGLRKEDMIEGVEVGGAAAFLSEARKAHITLFI